MYRYLALIIILFAPINRLVAAEISYAVLGYETTDKISVNKISAFVSKRITAKSGSKVIPSTKAKQLLKENNFVKNNGDSGSTYCRKVGEILAVDYLVYGKVWRSGNQISVESYLVNAATGYQVGHTIAQESILDNVQFNKAVDRSISELIKNTNANYSTGIKQSSLANGNNGVVWYKHDAIQWFLDRLEIGLRTSHFGLLNDSERHYGDDGVFIGGYLGSISDLEREQSYFPTIYANFIIRDWVALQFGYEKFEMGTVTYWDGHSDGTFNFNGPSLTAQFRYPNKSDFIPYAGIGIVMLNADFDMVNWWHHGFGGSDPEEAYSNWIESGAPDWPNGGYERNLTVDEDLMFKPVFQGGCYWNIKEHLSLDMDIRYISLDTELDYTLSSRGTVFSDRGSYDFPMDAWIFDIGILYRF